MVTGEPSVVCGHCAVLAMADNSDRTHVSVH